MKNFKKYFDKWYAEAFDLGVFLSTVIFLVILFAIETSFNISSLVNDFIFPLRFLFYVAVFSAVYLFPIAAEYFLRSNRREAATNDYLFLLLAIAIPALDSSGGMSVAFLKNHSVPREWFFFLKSCGDNIIQAMVLVIPVMAFNYLKNKNISVYGLKVKRQTYSAYFIFLLLASVIVVILSFQKDFRLIYPRFRPFQAEMNYHLTVTMQTVIFEIFYGLAFVSTEIFYRGFLILAAGARPGMKAVLPAASLYCLIHYQKPLIEIVSAFPGGLVLGIITAATGSIYGGIIVHLGLAWMMELAGNMQIYFYGDLLLEEIKSLVK